MSIDDQTFKQYQMRMLDIMCEIRRICEKHDIKYFLAYGTLLGAIRHEGFIPWDYDADIEMLREDYEKFITICAFELNDKYFLSTLITDKNAISPHARLCLNNTKVVFALFQNNIEKGHQGIFVDIFPIDIVPALRKEQKRHMNNNLFLRSIWLLKINPIYTKNLASSNTKARILLQLKNVAKSIARLILLPLPMNSVLKCMNRNAAKHRKSRSPYRAYVMSASPYINRVFDERLFYTESTIVYFENEPFTVTSRYEEYLTVFYRNYMEIPSKQEQEISRNCITEVVFSVDETSKRI
jgi:lipopolysaccharide cholinephosphotransferase